MEEIDKISSLPDCLIHYILSFLTTKESMDGAWGSFDPKFVNLPLLKSLNLGWNNIVDEFIQRLLSNCPVIEELTLENCFLELTKKITCLSLKKLTIRNTVFGPNTFWRVFMPNLEYLSCQINLGTVDFVNLSNLQHAIVNIYGYKGGYGDSENLEKMLKKEAQNLPVFKSLESLELISCTINDDLDPIGLFLNRSPNLKKFILQNISMKKKLVYSFVTPDIQCGNLKTVEIVSLKNDTKLHELVNNLVLILKGVENFSIIRKDAIDDSYAPKFIKYKTFSDFVDARD